MIADEIVALAGRPGHAIGAHTTHHLFLPRQLPELQEREIVENRAALGRLLGAEVSTFSYPFGAHDMIAVEIARRAGFSAAVTVEPAAVTPSGDSSGSRAWSRGRPTRPSSRRA